MFRTRIELPDGSSLFSGADAVNAVAAVSLTETVNTGTELTLGSCCCGAVDVSLITPDGGLSLGAGEQIRLYRVDESGQEQLQGIYILEKPERTGVHTMRFTAYDRVSLLDRDLTAWLSGLSGWPYSLYAFAGMVCGQCGLTLKNTELPNGSFQVHAFHAQGVTGRQLMRWVGEAAGMFSRATAEGELEFAWYTPAQTVIGPRLQSGAQAEFSNGELRLTCADALLTDGPALVTDQITASVKNGELTLELAPGCEHYYLQGGLTLSDYTAAPVEKVWIGMDEQDAGAVYPDVAGAVNTYRITGNYLLTADSTQDLKPIAQSIYERLRDLCYTPCKVTLPAQADIGAGNWVQVLDSRGDLHKMLVMTRSRNAQTDRLECTGSASRESTTAVNEQSYQAVSGKVLRLRTEVEGLRVENADMAGNVAQLSLNVENIRTQVQRQQSESEGLATQLTTLEQDAQQVALTVQTIRDEGVDKVTTATGYTFNEEGLRISKDGEQMENLLDNTGMYVQRSGETILQANDAGVVATDVTVRNFLIVGGHARFEDYTGQSDPDRVACFYVN